MMADSKRQRLVAILKGEPQNSRQFAEAIREADLRTLAEAARECILKASVTVNRKRFDYLIERLLWIVTQAPEMELANGKEGNSDAR